jgi:hypothetical protein
MLFEMKVNMQNYEEYFVRFVDNDLSAEEADEVQLFLQQHPGLKAELDSFRSAVLIPDASIQFSGKELLKKGVTMANCGDYFAREVENDLLPYEKELLIEFLAKHPEMQRERNAWQSTVLVADESIVYPDKKSLKKRTTRVIPIGVRYMMTAAVAAGLLLIFFVKGIEWNRNINGPQVAQEESSTTKEEGSGDVDNETSKNAQPSSQEIAAAPASTGKPATEKESTAASGKVTKKHSQMQETVNESPVMVAENITALPVSPAKGIAYHHRLSKAPYLVPVREGSEENVATRNSTPASGWLSVASVLGSEMLRLSGRGDLVKNGNSGQEHTVEKEKEALALAIQSKKFSLYHKFFNKKKSSENLNQ